MSTQRLLISGLLIIVLGAIGYFGYGLMTESETEEVATSQRQSLPNAVLQTTSGGSFQFSSIPQGKPVVLMFFSPTCPYCQEETAEITTHANLNDEAAIVMVSTFSRQDLNAYIDQYGLNDFGNIRVVRDFGGSLFQEYGVQSVPYTVVYDGSHQMVRAFRGKASADRLYAAVTSPESARQAPMPR